MDTKKKVGVPLALGLVVAAAVVFGGIGYLLFGRPDGSSAPVKQAAGEANDPKQLADIAKDKSKGADKHAAAD